MNKLFCKILFSTSLLIFLQNHALAQNIFDELKKAGEQLQKEIDKPDVKQKPPASGGQQPATTKPPAANKQPSETKPTTNSKSASSIIDEHQFILFDIKIGDPIQNAKLTGKQYSQDFYMKNHRSDNNNDYIRSYANQLFTPKTKNDLFDEYFISYGPYTQKIVGIYGKTKKVYKTVEECNKELIDPGKFVYDRLVKENSKWTFEPSGGPTYFAVTAYNNEFNKAMNYREKSIEIYQSAMLLKTSCQLNSPGYISLARHPEDFKRGMESVVEEQKKFLAELKKKDFEQKKDSGKLKGL